MSDAVQQVPPAPPQPAVSLVTDLNALRDLLAGKLIQFRQAISVAVLQLEGESAEVSDRLDAISVNDGMGAAELGEALKLAVVFTDRAKEFFDPWRELFYDPYKAVLDCKAAVLGTVEGSIKTAKRRILTYEQEEADRQKAAAAIRQTEQDAAEAARKLELAVNAEAAGLNEEAVDTILDSPSIMPTVQAAPVARPAGVSRRENWKAEVKGWPANREGLADLVTATAEQIHQHGPKGAPLLYFLQPHLPNLDKEAKKCKGELAIPGVRAVDEGSLAIRR